MSRTILFWFLLALLASLLGPVGVVRGQVAEQGYLIVNVPAARVMAGTTFVGEVRSGQRLPYTQRNGDWFLVETQQNGATRRGWIHRDDVLLETASRTESSRADPPRGDNGTFENLFDGQSLNGWTGDRRYWSVADGVLRARVTDATRVSRFLVSTTTADDFELRFLFRLRSGNSGLQFRSKDLGNDAVAGYQADIGFKDRFGNLITGRIFDERIRGHRFLSDKPGKELRIDATGNVTVVGDAATAPELAKLAVLEDATNPAWHEYQIVAKGNEIVLRVDGVVTTRLIDNDPNAPRSGVFAIQLWGPTEVEFKEMRLKRLR